MFPAKVVKTKSQKLAQQLSQWLFVGNISYNCSDAKLNELVAAFAEYGEVVEYFPKIKDGRVWIKFAKSEAAYEALKALDHQVFGGRPLYVDLSRCPRKTVMRPRARSMDLGTTEWQ